VRCNPIPLLGLLCFAVAAQAEPAERNFPLTSREVHAPSLRLDASNDAWHRSAAGRS
jgi:hypothetical protein